MQETFGCCYILPYLCEVEMNGKGDTRRPMRDREKYNESWDWIFKKINKGEDKASEKLMEPIVKSIKGIIDINSNS